MQIAITKTESMKDTMEKDLKEALQAQRSLSVKVETLNLEKMELRQLVEMKSNFIQGIQERNSLAASAGARIEDKNRQTLMYLETIQKLSMYIVRKQKDGEFGQGIQLGEQLDHDTMQNIKSMMDENVFDLLDKTETKVLQLQRENIELLEELNHFYQDSLTKDEQVSVIYEILAQIQRVIDQLVPSSNGSVYSHDAVMSPLINANLKHDLPEAVINVLNKVYARRFDFEKQSKKYAQDKLQYEQNIAKCDQKLTLLQSLNGQEW